MLVPPYNDFFKVGVSESGNHDNNIYGYTWAEQYHGIDEVDATGKASTDDGSMPADTSTKFKMHVPTTVEMAANLKGNLLLETGDMDNNVHPGNTIRLVNALIKANKRFDFMMFPGMPHGYGTMQAYSQRLMLEYFAEHLLGDYNRANAAYDHAR
jgi:dipeptidyl aminopeptidase/acylaminoacyl peptidase